MSSKRLIVCCDGTWNDADSAGEFTNVVRIARAVLPTDLRGGRETPQIVYYQSGVGTGADLVQRVLGGSVGLGLSRNVRDAYGFIAANYCPADEIFLFGFSRGAYTARSVAGLIGYAGLLQKGDMDDFAVVWEGYRLKNQPGQPDVLAHFPLRHKDVAIKCIGVWDTVGELGIPGHLDEIFTQFYQFHDTTLGPHVENAFHALALDERRSDFTPTLWIQSPEAEAAGTQKLVQVWFPGVHSNVGGGYEEHGLSDVALAWMAGQVDPLLALDVEYLKTRQDRRNGWGLGRIYDSAAGAWKLRGTTIRRPFTTQPQNATFEELHASLAERRGPNAACVPAPYDCPGLGGIAVGAKLAPLSPFEQQLKWTPAQTGVSPASQRPRPTLLTRLLKDLGGG
jgi:uncharacterized protein (DUF2235 family)